jgi:zinc transport system substrate-binding protein
MTVRNRFRLAFLIISLLTFLPSGCGRRGTSEKHGINILCTIYPVWLLVANVTGDTEGVNLDLLLPANASPHNTGLRPNDLQKISSADIIIINGYDVEFEMQIADAILQENPAAVQIVASEGVKPLFFGEVAGENKHDEHEHKPGSRDPHTWVSPKQAILLVKNIRDGLAKADPIHAEKYRANAGDFIKQLETLVADFDAASIEFKKRDIVTGHMAFGYLARDFGINIVAVIEVIPQQEPSASELMKISQKIKATNAAAIFTEPLVRSRVAETLAEVTGIPVKTLNPCHMGAMDRGEYIRNMRENLKELKNALM